MVVEGRVGDGEVALRRVGCSEGAIGFEGRGVDAGDGLYSGFSDYFFMFLWVEEERRFLCLLHSLFKYILIIIECSKSI